MPAIDALNSYFEHIEIVGLFSVLLITGILFSFMPSAFLNSGGAFMRISELGIAVSGPEFVLTLLFSFFTIMLTSILISLFIMTVKSKASFYSPPSGELAGLLVRFTGHMSLFFIMLFGIAFIVQASVLYSGAPMHYANLFIFLLYLPFTFVPVSIVVDENNVIKACAESIRFISAHAFNLFYYWAVSVVLVLVITLISFVLDPIFFMGKYASLILNTLFVLPYLVALQTHLYLHKYTLMKPKFRR
ncbi:MAG: hypothetical protein JXA43_02095 [Candidatus Diapherotrites archaeon]|nr:hypothetical protein [Candidatus Diapherotrites archaeon]